MQKHVVYVPKFAAAHAQHLAIDLAGGVTLSPGHRGYWRDATGVLIEDDITLATIFEAGTEARDAIVTYLHDHGEQAVAYETNGVPSIIDAPQEVAA